MKTCKLITCVFLFHASFLFGQDKGYNASFQRTPLGDILDSLENQSNLDFYYSENWVDSVLIDVTYNSDSLDDVLDQVLSATNLFHTKYDGRIILTNKIAIRKEIFAGFLLKEPRAQVANLFDRDFIDPTTTTEIISVGDRNNAVSGFAVISGRVTDMSNNPLGGVLVFQRDKTISTTTDKNGNYVLEVPTGKMQLSAQFAGKEKETKDLVVFSDGQVDFQLREKVTTLDELVIESNRDQNVQEVQMGLNRIDINLLEKIPKVLGEADLLKVVTTLPGVQSAGEGTPGI